MIQPSQCRAARALLEWTQPDLAAKTGLSVVTVRSFEKGGEMRDSNRNLLRMKLETAGVEFIPESYSRAGKLERGQEIVAGDDPADRRENVEKKAYRLT